MRRIGPVFGLETGVGASFFNDSVESEELPVAAGECDPKHRCLGRTRKRSHLPEDDVEAATKFGFIQGGGKAIA